MSLITRASSLAALALVSTSPLLAEPDLDGQWQSLGQGFDLPTGDATNITFFSFYSVGIEVDGSTFTQTEIDLLNDREFESESGSFTLGHGPATGFFFANLEGTPIRQWVNTEGDVLLWPATQTSLPDDEIEPFDRDIFFEVALKVPETLSAEAMAGTWIGAGYEVHIDGLILHTIADFYARTYMVTIRADGTLDYALTSTTDEDEEDQLGLTFRDVGWNFSGGYFVMPSNPDQMGIVNAAHDIMLLAGIEVETFDTFVTQDVFLRQPTSLVADDVVGTWAAAALYLWDDLITNAYSGGEVERDLIDLRADGTFTVYPTHMTEGMTGPYQAEGVWEVEAQHLVLTFQGEEFPLYLNASKNFAARVEGETDFDGGNISATYFVKLSDEAIDPALAYYPGSEPLDHDGLMRNPWFGHYWSQHYPWIYHPDHHWLWSQGDGGASMVYYDQTLGWVYTTPELYPMMWIYDYEGTTGWFSFMRRNDATRVFWDFAVGAKLMVND
ncbi:MAG: hypothetical protein Q7P63_05650 [Verrucomicrobiota bacterium JB022]|nr:hypothetical protein [Verrucomicrobiota bacterium JB022]